MNDNSAPHGGGYGKDIVTVIAQSSQQPKKYLEGRKELEADASTTSTSAGVNSGGMGTGKHQFQHHESSNCPSSPLLYWAKAGPRCATAYPSMTTLQVLVWLQAVLDASHPVCKVASQLDLIGHNLDALISSGHATGSWCCNALSLHL